MVDAPAKINLSLDVGLRRLDGYHPLVSLFQPLALCDTLECRKTAAGISLVVVGGGRIGPMEQNLVYRAAAALGLGPPGSGIAVRLVKRIPVAAGLGGGSQDAAAALRAFAALWPGRFAEQRLWQVAIELGSDVPFGLCGGAALVSGRGEQVRSIALPSLWVVLAMPPEGTSTGGVYAAFDRQRPRPHHDSGPLLNAWWSGRPDLLARWVGNGLQEVTERQRPDVAQLLQVMRSSGATGAAQTGSGPAVFGLFRDFSAAQRCVIRVRAHGAQTWCTRFLEGATPFRWQRN